MKDRSVLPVVAHLLAQQVQSARQAHVMQALEPTGSSTQL